MQFLFFLPFIITGIISLAIFLTIIFVVIKSAKNNSNYISGNSNDIAKSIKQKLNAKSNSNICEYCGSIVGDKAECENCGAKISKK